MTDDAENNFNHAVMRLHRSNTELGFTQRQTAELTETAASASVWAHTTPWSEYLEKSDALE